MIETPIETSGRQSGVMDLPLQDLQDRCAEETARYRRGEPYTDSYGWELFRRAIVLDDNDAWTALYNEYTEMVRWWLRLEPNDDSTLVDATFTRFWRAVNPAKFALFSSLSAILGYLKMCAQTARIDLVRSTMATKMHESLDGMAALAAPDDVLETVVGQMDGSEIWRIVDATLADDRERLIAFLSFVGGLSPRQICAYHGAQFPLVEEVYRLKRSIVDRLRRCPDLRAWRHVSELV